MITTALLAVAALAVIVGLLALHYVGRNIYRPRRRPPNLHRRR